MKINKRGTLFVISAPSGTGKGTVINALLVKHKDDVRLSVSATTRKPRDGEVDGIHYHFKTKAEFEEMIANDGFLEWASFCDNYYGTPKKFVDDNLQKGIDVLLEIEIQGAMKIMESGVDATFIFILPPSFEELRNRLIGRQTESIDVIEKRLETAKKELKYASKYDYIVVNDLVENAVYHIESILDAEKSKTYKNLNLLDEEQKL